MKRLAPMTAASPALRPPKPHVHPARPRLRAAALSAAAQPDAVRHGHCLTCNHTSNHVLDRPWLQSIAAGLNVICGSGRCGVDTVVLVELH